MPKELFRSLDRCTSAICEVSNFALDSPSVVQSSSTPYSAMGSGRSIVAASFRQGVHILKTRAPRQNIYLNSEKTLVTVPAGMTVVELSGQLFPRGLSLNSLPSYPNVTIGGCIATNVHGQNHYREGCFGNQIEELTLFHPDKGVIKLSRDVQPDIFELTIGGLGLTGVILDVTLQLTEISSSLLDVTVKRFGTLYESYEILLEQKDNFDYFHSWCDLANKEPRNQRGFLHLARFRPITIRSTKPLDARDPIRPHYHFCPNIFGTSLIKYVNKLYFHQYTRSQSTVKTLCDFIFPSKNRLYYFSLFGPAGLFEHQVLIPHASVKEYLRRFNLLIKEQTPVISLCHMKLFQGEQRHLNFDGSGFCLAIHVPANPKTFDFLQALDRIDNDFGCIANLVKDSRLPASVIASQYSQLDIFRSTLGNYDPGFNFQNTISNKIFDA